MGAAKFSIGRMVRGEPCSYDEATDWLHGLLEMPGCISGYVEQVTEGYRPITIWDTDRFESSEVDRVKRIVFGIASRKEPCQKLTVHTVQISKWRKVKEKGALMIDSTVKSGHQFLAPSWDIVMGVKHEHITEEEYTEVYEKMMDASIETQRLKWEELIRQGNIAIACYCPSGKFCHRHLIIPRLEKLCEYARIEFEYAGEIE